MSNAEWSQGYVTDSSYADTFFRELSPAWLNYVAVLGGAHPLQLDRRFTYLELGCGYGTSAVINAGAFPHAEFHACDFNPQHIEGGRRHAAALGIHNIRFHECTFQQVPALDLPDFDVIVLHGVYSWVGAPARLEIRRVVREKLTAGGLAYVSYNCFPGWSTELPLRRLMVELAATSGDDSSQRSEHALRALKELSRSKFRYFSANPEAVKAIDAYAARPSNYVAHEFFNETWEPFYSIDVADELAEAELTYLGSATLADNHQELVADDVAIQALAQLPTARQRQLAMDFAANRRFRRDVFIRGRPRLDKTEIVSHINAAVIGSVGHSQRIGTTAKVPRGEIRFQEEFIEDLQALMRRGSMPLGEIVAALSHGNRDVAQITRNVLFLVAAGTLMPFAKTRGGATLQPDCRLASQTVQRALAHIIAHQDHCVVPSEVVGNGVEIKPLEALAVTEFLTGAKDADVLAGRLQAGIERLNIQITHDRETVRDREKLAAYCKMAAHDAITDLVPSLVRLGLII